MRVSKKILFWSAGSIAVLFILLLIASEILEEPVRRRMEARMNEALQGYSVRLPALDLHPVGFAVTLTDLTLLQKAHPDPPVAVFPELTASVHWKEILFGRLVADFLLIEPDLHINVTQLREEARSEVPVEERGWQEAVQAIYPLKINLFEVHDGRFTYIDEEPENPLRLTAIHLHANNIRNIHSPERTYPSPIWMEAVIFQEGKGSIEGYADFLSDPYPGVNADIRLNNISLAQLKPVSHHINLQVSEGTLTAEGQVEYAPSVKSYHLRHAILNGLQLDYLHSAATAEAEKKRAEKVTEAVGEAARRSDVKVQVDLFEIENSTIGYINRAEEPGYRLYISSTDAKINNYSDDFRRGKAEAVLSGRFMGSGNTAVTGTFRPEKKSGPDFDLNVVIEDTALTRMNELLETYGNFDVAGGSFSLYSEITVDDGRIDGYVKPFLKDPEVYSAEQEEGEGFLQRTYEAIVGAVGKLLENAPREEVATKVDISGPLEDPKAGTGAAILQLIRNGFFNAILPGFETSAGEGEGE